MGGTNIPDVRVRLSAEGVDEVIRAFKKVQDAANKGGQGFGGLNGALSKLQGILPALGFATSAAGLALMVKNALDAMAAIGKLSEKTGLSTETLSVMRLEMKKMGLETDDASKLLAKFNKKSAELDEGSSAAAASVRRLFGSSAALDGLNTEQRFLKVTKAIAGMDAGYRKTKTAQDFFGKSGAEMIPLLNKLGTNFDELRAKTEKAGQLLSSGTVASARAAKRALAELKDVGEGMAIQFTTGLAPALAQVGKSLAEAFSGKGLNGLQVLGELVGKVLISLTKLLVGTGSAIGFFAGELALLFEGRSKGFKERLRELNDELNAQSKMLDSGKPLDQTGGAAPNTETQKAQLEAVRARLERELALFRKQDELVAAQQKTAFEDGQISLTAYYDGRAKVIRAGAAKEMAILQAELSALQQAPLGITEADSGDQIKAKEIKREQDVAAVKNKIRIADLDGQKQLADLKTAENKDQLAFLKTFLDVQNQIAEAQGHTFEAAQRAIELQLEQLRRAGISEELLKQLRAVKDLAAKLTEVQRQGSLLEGSLGVVRAQLDTRVATGALFPTQALRLYDAAVQALLPKLQAMATQELELATQSGDPKRIQDAQRRIEEIAQLGAAADRTSRDMRKFKEGIESALTSDLTDFFTTGIQQAKNFRDAMLSMASAVVTSIQRIVAELIAAKIVESVLAFIGFSGGGKVGSPVGGLLSGGVGAGGPMVAAVGGFIRGPGTGTSDSIPAMLSHGEFVVRAAAVRRPGVLPLLADINGGLRTPTLRSALGIPRFESGGIVDAAAATGGGGGSAQVAISLDDGLVARQIENGPGSRAVIRTIAQNRNAIRQALGLR